MFLLCNIPGFLEQTGYNASKLYAKFNEKLYIIEERCVCP